MSETLTIRRWGNCIDVSSNEGPTPLRARELLEEELSYSRKEYVHPARAKLEGIFDKVVVSRRHLFDYDQKGRLATNAGFLRRVKTVLEGAGYHLLYQDKSPLPANPDTFKADKSKILKHFSFRPRQEEALDALLFHRSGLIEAPTGFGKMALGAMACLALPNASIDIVTRRVALVENWVEYLSRYMRAGQIGGGVNKPAPRVNVYTADSLHKSPANADILLCDEAHELLADDSSKQLARYRLSRMFAFTASPEGRFDGADVRMEAFFGGTIFRLTYQEAVKLGLVAQIHVEWKDVDGRNPAEGVTHDTERKRRALWRNLYRNTLVAESALSFGDDQVMVLVDTVEHAVSLRPLLSGFELVYGNREEGDMRRYIKEGLLPYGWPAMTKHRRLTLRDQFASGELRKVIATGVWSTGVDFTHLQALVLANGGASDIYSIQAPGRAARVNRLIGKEVGVLCDFRDQFDSGYANRAKQRSRCYARLGWDQV